MSKPTRLKRVSDVVLFVLGVWVIISQTGFPWLVDQPSSGPSIPTLAMGMLLCNSPVMLQALAIRFGSGTSQPGASQPPSPPAPPSVPSSDV